MEIALESAQTNCKKNKIFILFKKNTKKWKKLHFAVFKTPLKNTVSSPHLIRRLGFIPGFYKGFLWLPPIYGWLPPIYGFDQIFST